MTPAVASRLLPLLHRLDPERAHSLALWALRSGMIGKVRPTNDPALAVTAFGLRFPNPVGLAAGFDKNAVAIDALGRLGFGFVETGTVTPRPQPGNARPRLFRLDADRAAINRLGFNNLGLTAYLTRISQRTRGVGVVGCNVGINKEGADPEKDYPALIAALAPHADYLVINVSSPNTPGLRDLQGEARLRGILQAVKQNVPQRPPLLVKISPDLSDADLEGLVNVCVDTGVQGLIVSNTTLSRPPTLRGVGRNEAGGLSGAPVFTLSTAVLAKAFLLARGRLALVGVGGVATGRDALTKIRAGCIFGATVYGARVRWSDAGISYHHRTEQRAAGSGISNLQQAIGVDAEFFAKGS